MSNNNSPIKMSTYKNLGQVNNKLFEKTSHRQVKYYIKHHILSLSHNNTSSCTSNYI